MEVGITHASKSATMEELERHGKDQGPTNSTYLGFDGSRGWSVHVWDVASPVSGTTKMADTMLLRAWSPTLPLADITLLLI
jgi:hypothetical protein